MPGFPKLARPLRDGMLSLRPAAERDIPEVLIAYQDDPQLHRQMGELRPPSAAELGRRAERMEADRIAGAGLTLTITAGDDDVCRGQLHVHELDWDGGRGELAVWVAPGWRGSGLARRSLALAGGWLLRDCGLHRVHVLPSPENQAMLRAALGAGFHLEGVLRGYRRHPRGRADAASLSLIRRDLQT
jgi:RimJ/RimL family protein N-acetyltransferase